MRIAIFDFEDTILHGNSWHCLFRTELWRRPERAPSLLTGLALRRAHFWTGRQLREVGLRGLRGIGRSDLERLGNQFYRRHLVPYRVPDVHDGDGARPRTQR